LLLQAAAQAQQEGKLPAVALPEVIMERPQNPEHGDYASSLPLKLARAISVNPLAIAENLVGFIPPSPEVESATAVPPGFINFTLKADWLAGQVDTIISAGAGYGDIDLGQGSRVQIEFVSVNPTGPLHVGHGRGAILGDTLANVLSASGYEVEKEYYVNDAGNQVKAFYRSLYARYQQCLGRDVDMPEDGYVGGYMKELAEEMVAEKGDEMLSLPEEDAVLELGKLGLDKMIGQIKDDLNMMRVSFDVWFSEQTLFDKGLYKKVM